MQNGRLAPPIGHNAHAVVEKRPEVEKFMIFSSDADIEISHTLFLNLPTGSDKVQSFRLFFPRRR